jgi:hypothetical protein
MEHSTMYKNRRIENVSFGESIGRENSRSVNDAARYAYYNSLANLRSLYGHLPVDCLSDDYMKTVFKHMPSLGNVDSTGRPMRDYQRR